MLCKVFCGCCDGLKVNTITVEVSVSEGIQFFLVGLADSAVKESQQRIANALGVYGYKIPGRRVVVNLAPANIKKEGSSFDVPIAIGILMASGQIRSEDEVGDKIVRKTSSLLSVDEGLQERLNKFFILGELALDGTLRSIRGALPIINHARKEGFKGCILPPNSALEGAEIEGIDVYAASNLKEVIDILLNHQFAQSKMVGKNWGDEVVADYSEFDFSQVRGQTAAKRGLEIAAAGGHNVIMVGSPGCGKTLMAKCIPAILPPMTKEESIETSEIYSVANLLEGIGGLIKKRPYRSPHHTITVPALVGGGARCLPGEISLAHNGVLFADELAEFDRRAIEVMRQPLENGIIEISRVRNKYFYPARFMFIGAMNPCPCGRLFDDASECKCTSAQIQKYQSKISGPILDRIDIYLRIKQVKASDFFAEPRHGEVEKLSVECESSNSIARRVVAAREAQYERYKRENFYTNAAIPHSKLSLFCKLESKEEAFIKKIVESLNISPRGYSRILKISRTIADLNGSERIRTEHIAMAVQLRYSDR